MDSTAPVFYLACFPSVGYMSKIVEFKRIQIEAFGWFEKSSYYNRYQIANSNGLSNLSIPILKGRNHKQLYADTCIDNYPECLTKHIKSWEAAYNRTPFFEFYIHELKKIMSESSGNLFCLNLHFLRYVLKVLRIDVEVSLTASYLDFLPQNVDYRNAEFPFSASNMKLPYRQVFLEKNGFIDNLSVLDLLFNMGPDASEYLLYR